MSNEPRSRSLPPTTGKRHRRVGNYRVPQSHSKAVKLNVTQLEVLGRYGCGYARIVGARQTRGVGLGGVCWFFDLTPCSSLNRPRFIRRTGTTYPVPLALARIPAGSSIDSVILLGSMVLKEATCISTGGCPPFPPLAAAPQSCALH